MTARSWGTTWLAIWVVLLAAAPRFPMEGSNAVTRWALSRAIVERHTLSIDGFEHLTVDRAFRDGHYYSDKAPGLSFLGAAAYAVVRQAGRIAGPASPETAFVLTRMLAVTLPTFAAMALALLWLRRRDFDPFWAGFWPTTWYAATPALVYANLFFSHQLTAVLLLSSLLVLELLHPRRWSAPLAGFLAGWAVITEYPAAIAAGILFLAYPFASRRRRWAFVCGSIPPLLLLAWYNGACFGSPFSLGYRHETMEEFATGMGRGFFGVTLPSLRGLFSILLSPARGMLFLSPFLALPLVARPRKPAAWRNGAAFVAVLLLLLVNASYWQPGGGACLGPRHLVPCLPVAVWWVARWARRSEGRGAVSVGMAVASGAHVAVMASANVLLPEHTVFPLQEFTLPLLAAGQTSGWWADGAGFPAPPLPPSILPALLLAAALVAVRARPLAAAAAAVATGAMIILPGSLLARATPASAFDTAFSLSGGGQRAAALSMIRPHLAGPLTAPQLVLAVDLLAEDEPRRALDLAGDHTPEEIRGPEAGGLAFHLGRAFCRLGDMRRAAEMSERAIRLGFTLPEAYLNQALALEALGQAGAARETLRPALASFPFEARIFLRAGRLAAADRDTAAARALLGRYLELDPSGEAAPSVRALIGSLPETPPSDAGAGTIR